MEFRFDLHPIFNQPIIKVNSNLLPIGFRGDRRTALDTATKIAEVINEMGEASARAQGLSNPVTTAQKLRQTDQTIYLLGDPGQGRNGAVVGLLKVGKKSLYVFDQNGQTKMVNAPCVLDFYVHESRQRSGLGKGLFDSMLQQEEFHPEKMAVDRPSDKLLGFLRKHYGLQKTIPQMNNFVVYDGFFENPQSHENNNVNNHNSRMHITASPNTALFGPQFINDEQSKRSKVQLNASNTSIPLIQSSPVGRYAAPRPMCSMAECLSSGKSVDGSGNKTTSNTNISRHSASKASIYSHSSLNNPNGHPSHIPKAVPSNISVFKPSPSNGGLNRPTASNMSVIRERAAGLPSQNYSQHGDDRSFVNEVPVPIPSAVSLDVNSAESIEKPNMPSQEINMQPDQSTIPVEHSNEIYHEVCPNCSAMFPSSRGSAIKMVQSETMLSNERVSTIECHANDPIIHNTATTATGEPNSTIQPSATEPYHQVIDESAHGFDLNLENLHISEHSDNYEPEILLQQEEHHEELTNGHNHHHHSKEKGVKINPVEHYIEEQEVIEPAMEVRHIPKPTSFPLSKQHTGLKNISYNVSLAVSPTNNMDFVPKQSEFARHSPRQEEKAAGLPSHDTNDGGVLMTSSPGSAGAAGGGAAFTDQGYFDLKFYHNRLW